VARRARILAIDDQLYFRSFIEGLLVEEGYEVATAASGAAALERLEREGPFDLVITDLVMPGMDGVETVKRICERWPAQPVIVVSGVGDVRAAAAALMVGAADYLLKPIDREGLARSVESALERGRMREENARLVRENVAALEALALLERAIPLFALERPRQVGEGLLGLLCRQAGARSGLLWLRDEERADYVSLAAHGGVALAEEPIRWDGGTEALRRALESGDPEFDAGAPGGTVYAPCSVGPRVVAVAALSELPAGAPGDEPRARVRRLAEIGAQALVNALSRGSLEAGARRDPRTGLASRSFLLDMARVELSRAQRFGRLLALLSLRVDAAPGAPADDAPDALHALPNTLQRAVRGTDLVASEGPGQYWILVSDANPLGSVVLRRRLAARLREFLRERGLARQVRIGVASYPADGEEFGELLERAGARASAAKATDEVAVDPALPLAQIGEQLLARGSRQPARFVSEAAALLAAEVGQWPADRGLLFVAPGPEAAALMPALTATSEAQGATEIFLATDGETMPSGLPLHALPLPPGVSSETTWLVRLGEGPAYALVAGPRAPDATREVFHSSDPSLVEELALRLHTELGLGTGG
jgi:diguanylate cyclase (GGDEF)-like protein